MSMEIFVLSNKRLGSISEWQQAIDAEGFVLRLDSSCPIEALGGYLPAHRGEEPAGFECDHWQLDDVTENTDIDFGGPWTEALAFRFGGDWSEAWGAYVAAAAYARATGGVIYDGEEGVVMTPDKSVAVARGFEQYFPPA